MELSVEIQKNHLYLINMGNKKIKNLPHEIWKDIKGYEGRYKISNRGRVKSLSHLVTRGFATCMTDEIILTPTNQGHYDKVGLFLGKTDSYRQLYIHRLVAEHFIPNPHNLPQIDHIDGNSRNNAASNLRWCNQTTNINNPITKYRSKKLRKVASFSLRGKKLKEYKSLTDASRDTGVPVSSICCLARGVSGMNGSKYGLNFRYI